MALFDDSDLYVALKRIFATNFFDKSVQNNTYTILERYMFLTEIQNMNWTTVFNHFVPDIDYNATITIGRDGNYYAHNQNYPVDINSVKYKFFIDSAVDVPLDDNNSIRISFGKKYKYAYL